MKEDILIAATSKILTALIGFFLTIILAQNIDLIELGQYYYLIALLLIPYVLGGKGLNVIGLKEISPHDNNLKKNLANKLLHTSLYNSLLVTFFTISIFLLIKLLGFLQEFTSYEGIIIGLTILPISLISIFSAIFQSFFRFALAILFIGGIQNIFLILIVLSSKNITSQELVLYYLASALISFFLCHLFLKFHIKGSIRYYPTKKYNHLFKGSKDVVLSQIVAQGFVQIPILILGIFMTKDMVAILSIFIRFSLLLGFVLQIINKVVAPRFAKLASEKNFTDLNILFYKSNIFIVLISFVLFLIIYFLSDFILGLYGESFLQYKLEFMIICFSQVLFSIPGVMNAYFQMLGRYTDVKNANLIGLIIGGVFSTALIPSTGLIGASISICITYLCIGIFLIYKKNKIYN